MAKCGVCNTGDLTESGCGCLNPACHNFIDKWKKTTLTYARPKPAPDHRSVEQLAKDEQIAAESQPLLVLPTDAKPMEAHLEPPKKKRGRPKKS